MGTGMNVAPGSPTGNVPYAWLYPVCTGLMTTVRLV